MVTARNIGKKCLFATAPPPLWENEHFAAFHTGRAFSQRTQKWFVLKRLELPMQGKAHHHSWNLRGFLETVQVVLGIISRRSCAASSLEIPTVSELGHSTGSAASLGRGSGKACGLVEGVFSKLRARDCKWKSDCPMRERHVERSRGYTC